MSKNIFIHLFYIFIRRLLMFSNFNLRAWMKVKRNNNLNTSTLHNAEHGGLIIEKKPKKRKNSFFFWRLTFAFLFTLPFIPKCCCLSIKKRLQSTKRVISVSKRRFWTPWLQSWVLFFKSAHRVTLNLKNSCPSGRSLIE